MPRRRRVDAPQPAAAAAPAISLITFLHVCLCLGAAIAPKEICNDYGCVVEVPAVSHFGAYNHCDAESEDTLIYCAGCNMPWCSDVCQCNNDNKDID